MMFPALLSFAGRDVASASAHALVDVSRFRLVGFVARCNVGNLGRLLPLAIPATIVIINGIVFVAFRYQVTESFAICAHLRAEGLVIIPGTVLFRLRVLRRRRSPIIRIVFFCAVEVIVAIIVGQPIRTRVAALRR